MPIVSRPGRWLVAVAATLMQVALGAVYAWSVFRRPLASALGASITDVNLVFTITNVTLGFAAFVGGLWMARVGPRTISLIAGALYGLGVFLAGVGGPHLPWLYLTYGALAGLGIGLGYIVPLATLVKWFPDRRGAITGVAVAGFGAGALVFGPIDRALLAAYDPFTAFRILGVVFFAVVCAAGLVMRDPPDGYRPSGSRPEPGRAQLAHVDHELGEALRTWQWYALWVVLFVSIGAGISIIAEAVPMAQELGGASEVAATALVGTIALFNGAGRLVWAALSDVIGRRRVFQLLFVTQAVVFLLLPVARGYTAFLALACVSLFCYGGGFGTMPAFVADCFGVRTVGKVYGLMLTAWSAGAVLGPMVVSRLRDATGSYTSGLHVMALVLAAGALVPGLVHAPTRPRAVPRELVDERGSAPIGA